MTGFSTAASREIVGKRIALLKEAVPTASKTAWLVPRRGWVGTWRALLDETAQATRHTMIEAVLEEPVDDASYRRAFDIMTRERADSIYVTPALENLQHRRLIAALAAEARLPAVYSNRENVEAGGLMAYGVDLADLFRRSAGYVDRILKGADPAAMPFQQPTRFELVLNLKTARALGLEISPSLLGRADEVIE
jgi:putative ABC transport system substrate-binding protein